jgi:hypothetical protein
MGSYGIDFQDSNILSGVSRVQAFSKEQINSMPNMYLCNSSRSGNCDPSKNSLQAEVILPKCENAAQTFCIDSLSLSQSNGTFNAASFIRTIGSSKLDGDPKEDLPQGTAPSLWKSDVLNAGNTATYEVIGIVQLDWRDGKFMPRDLSVEVNPYSEITGSFQATKDEEITFANGRIGVSTSGHNPGCVWTDAGLCGVREDFSRDTQVRLAVRLSSAIGGWFKGRLSSPAIQVTPTSGTANLVTVSGAAVNVPQVSIGVPHDSAPDAIKQYFAKMGGYVDGFVTSRSDYPNSFDALELFREVARDKSQGSLTKWSFGTFGAAGNPCLTNTTKVLGLVTTNATLYTGQAPSFQDGQLTYKVAGYHYLADDSLNLGTYDLIMRKDTARCLYNFGSAPISATVSVSSDKGVENVATTTFTEDENWDHFQAYGFTFSQPSISIKLTQEKPAVAPGGGAKRTITCVKGKLTKKVSGTAPKCPAGYKKK